MSFFKETASSTPERAATVIVYKVASVEAIFQKALICVSGPGIGGTCGPISTFSPPLLELLVDQRKSNALSLVSLSLSQTTTSCTYPDHSVEVL